MKRKRRLRVGLAALGAVAGLAGVTYGLAGLAARTALARRMEAGRRIGMAVAPEDVQPPIPGAENAAPLYRRAYRIFGSNVSPVRTLFYQPDFASPAWRAQAKTALADLKPGLDLYAAATRLPHCDYRRDWSLGAALLEPEPGGHRFGVELLAAEARFADREGRTGEAFDLLETAARAARQEGEDPLEIAALVESKEEDLIAAGLEDVFNRDGLKPGVPERAARVVDAMGPPIDIRRAMRGDSILAMDLISNLNDPAWLKRLGGSEDASLGPWATAARLEPIGKAWQVNAFDYWYDVARFLPKDSADIMGAYRAFRKAEAAEDARTSWATPLSVVLAPAEGGFALAAGEALERRRCLRAEIAALEIRRRTGAFPSTLPLSGPEAIDPIAERPLRYRLTPQGFLVYGVGRDRTDDGGTAGARFSTKADVVVQYPYVPPAAKF